MTGNWTITGIKQGGTFRLIGQDCIQIDVEMPVHEKETRGVKFYIPEVGILGDPVAVENSVEQVWTVRDGTTIFRTVLQPIELREAVGPSAIPSSAPAEVVWDFVPAMALPAS